MTDEATQLENAPVHPSEDLLWDLAELTCHVDVSTGSEIMAKSTECVRYSDRLADDEGWEYKEGS